MNNNEPHPSTSRRVEPYVINQRYKIKFLDENLSLTIYKGTIIHIDEQRITIIEEKYNSPVTIMREDVRYAKGYFDYNKPEEKVIIP